MSKDDGGPAFPQTKESYAIEAKGMSLRDWFAGQALAWLVDKDTPHCDCLELVGEQAYEIADAMLKARQS